MSREDSVALSRRQTSKSVHLRHGDVEQDQVRRVLFRGLQRLAAIGKRAHIVSPLTEQVRQQAQVVDGIVNHQHTGGGCGELAHHIRSCEPRGTPRTV